MCRPYLVRDVLPCFAALLLASCYLTRFHKLKMNKFCAMPCQLSLGVNISTQYHMVSGPMFRLLHPFIAADFELCVNGAWLREGTIRSNQ